MNLPPVPGSSLPPPPPPPPPSPVAPASQFSRPAKLGLALGGLVMLVLVILAGLRAPPTNEAARLHVVGALRAQGFEVQNCFVTDFNAGPDTLAASLMVMVKRGPVKNYPAATAEAFGPAAAKLGPPWTELDFAAWQRIQQLLQGRNGPRLAAVAGLELELKDLASLTFVVEEETAPSSYQFNPTLTARRQGFRWHYELSGIGEQQNALVRTPKDYPGRVCIVNRSEAREELATLARRLPAIGAALDRAVEQLGQEQRAAVLALLQPRALFAGSLQVNTFRPAPPARVCLEITEVRADENPVSLSALLRNQGSWVKSRVFSGTVQFDAVTGSFSLRLAAPEGSQQEDYGPFLANAVDGFTLEQDEQQNCTVTLACDGKSLTGSWSGTTLQLSPVPAAEREALGAEFQGDYPRLLAATKEGAVYTGSITTRAQGTKSAWWLRITGQTLPADAAGEDPVILAVLEPMERTGAKCELRGTIEPNRYRAAGRPLRFDRNYSGNFKMPPEAEAIFTPGNDTSTPEDVALWLKLDGRRLVGENARFVFRFEPATAEAIAARDRP